MSAKILYRLKVLCALSPVKIMYRIQMRPVAFQLAGVSAQK